MISLYHWGCSDFSHRATLIRTQTCSLLIRLFPLLSSLALSASNILYVEFLKVPPTRMKAHLVPGVQLAFNK